MSYIPDEYQAKALTTWYSSDNPLYLNPLHPLIKLAGEAGELLDLYGKHEYKQGFDWWDCKHCGELEIEHSKTNGWCYPWTENQTPYTPLVLDELGDWFYYARIITYINQISFEDLYIKSKPSSLMIDCMDILGWLIELNKGSIKLLDELYSHSTISNIHLSDCLYRFQCVLSKLNCTLDHLTDLNYRKLNNENHHGWKNATIKSEVK